MESNQPLRTSSQVMELRELIAGPLLATIDADSMSTQRYLDYLMYLAFESYDPVSGRTGPLRMLSFTYSAQDLSGSRCRKVSIPLLTLVPLPLLQIREADFDYDVQILDALTEQPVFSFGDEGRTAARQSSDVRLRVCLAPSAGVCTGTQTRRDLSANMKVHVKMRQADMPGGLSNLLNMTANNVTIDDMAVK